jgi:hypothetical protein
MAFESQAKLYCWQTLKIIELIKNAVRLPLITLVTIDFLLRVISGFMRPQIFKKSLKSKKKFKS